MRESLEWVLCCLDVASTVSSLSRCSILCQVPRVYERERERERERESVYLCMCVAVCDRKPLSGSCVVLNVASTVSSLSRCSVLSQVPGVYERERESVCVRIYVCSSLWEKALSGSCVVWMLRPLSAACQDAPSYVRYPEFTRERERESVCMYVCV